MVQSSPTFSADVVIERSSGDLTVTDDSGTRTLGLSDLRVGLNARDGTWSFSTGLAGKTLGQAAGAVVVRSTPKATWPAPTRRCKACWSCRSPTWACGAPGCRPAGA